MSKLREIFENKRREVADSKARVPLAELESIARDQEPSRGFKSALETAGSIALIAEIKAASPSQGAIRPGLDAAEVARTYESVGATAISVLTDAKYFEGSDRNLKIAKENSRLPVLRKDFLDDPYQIVESCAWGADAVLLIVAALDPAQLSDLYAQAKSMNMDVLTEAHDEREVDVALECGCDIIGVNNRNLNTFETCLSVSDALLPRIAPHALAVSESAIENHEDVRRVQESGAKAVLIGTTFCAATDIGAKVREVMGWE